MWLGIAPTIYASVACSQVINFCYFHSWGHLLQDFPVKIPELSMSWCSICLTVLTNALVNHECSPLRAGMNCSGSSLRTPAAQYIVSWRPSTPIFIHSHPMACCFLFLGLPVLPTIFKCVSWVICESAILAALRWNTWCWCHCCVSPGGTLGEAPVVRIDSDPLAACRGVCGAMICCCGNGEEEDH